MKLRWTRDKALVEGIGIILPNQEIEVPELVAEKLLALGFVEAEAKEAAEEPVTGKHRKARYVTDIEEVKE